jgi:hypothetical protein
LIAPVYEPQTQTNWCWAACVRMAGSAFGCNVPAQCDLASQFLNVSGCRTAPSSTPCNQALNARLIPGLYAAFGMHASAAPTSDPALQQALAASGLVLVLLDIGTGYHFALLTGYAGGSYSVDDPRYGASSVPYAQIASAYGMGSLLNAWIIGPRPTS